MPSEVRMCDYPFNSQIILTITTPFKAMPTHYSFNTRFRAILVVLFFAFSGVLVLAPVPAHAQCPMCKMTAESNLKNGGSDGKGLNTGILYILIAPYLLTGIVGFLWWRSRKPDEEHVSEVFLKQGE